MNQKQKLYWFFGIAIIFLAGIAVGILVTESTTKTEYIEYTEFSILENCNITAIDQKLDNTTEIWFDTTSNIELNSITVNGRTFGTSKDWEKTYTFLIAKRPDNNWQLIHYESLQK